MLTPFNSKMVGSLEFTIKHLLLIDNRSLCKKTSYCLDNFGVPKSQMLK